MRGDVLALSDGSDSIAFAFPRAMQKKNISIFVDESGNFGDIKDSPR